MANWRNVWYVAIAIYLFDAVFFVIFGSGEEQYWSTIYVDDNSKSDTSKQEDKIMTIEQRTEIISSLSDSRDIYDASHTQQIPRAKLE